MPVRGATWAHGAARPRLLFALLRTAARHEAVGRPAGRSSWVRTDLGPCSLRCGNQATAGDGVILSGTGDRRAVVTAELHLLEASIQPGALLDEVRGVILLITTEEAHRCDVALVGAHAGALSRQDERVTVTCAWPGLLPAGRGLVVATGLESRSSTPGATVRGEAVVTSITVSD